MNGKKIIIGITGSIAAYKGVILARELVRRGSVIRVAMTDAASHFITPLTFASISKHPVALNMYPPAGAEPANGSWHIEWALWADAMVIAPATASTIAKLAVGLSDNALTVIATAMRGKVFVAPAMDSDMHNYPAFDRNIATLRSFGMEVIPSERGELASGLVGVGRMAEPDAIVNTLNAHFVRSASLADRTVLITAGPTYEPIDPVRFIGNHSSGKMGYALAEEARDRGARVILVSGPTSLPDPSGITTIRVSTAAEMGTAVDLCSDDADIVIAAAAVADFTPVDVSRDKLKRRELAGDELRVTLQPTRDILRSLGERKRAGQILVGFALETSALIESAREKMVEKNCDMIVANPANEPGAGFSADTNRVTLVTASGERELPSMTKRACAFEIFERIEELASGERRTAAVEHGWYG
ncbi:MAG: bifunctional phosphopantothenoylcysteine decarboxylase/phosphopantothenate--cysteine ligase CoaBC [Bacteroidetes bacterium]|nr:bifunctional phosphopantothenoylcysteine decarboxylase/phosphopantothenate--cysteine ligase CoaBC [Bacteroidota bacterium]